MLKVRIILFASIEKIMDEKNLLIIINYIDNKLGKISIIGNLQKFS